MKRVLLLFVFVASFILASGQVKPWEAIAIKVSNKMKDTLSLSESTHGQIYFINWQLGRDKSMIWQEYSGSDSLIRYHLQRLENMRDSLYLPILGEEKFSIYRQKKTNLISNF
ncbi:MAG: hypothetical protein H7Y42_14035 [Chitinophagaceae bacterium]|nr:hypothetical protein [Chitinophagaceae bacterium]